MRANSDNESAGAVSGVNTYWLTDAMFAKVFKETEYDEYDTFGGMTDESIVAVADTWLGIESFYFPSVSSPYQSWTGIKAQPWPAAAWTDKFRFEGTESARGYIYF